MIKYILTTNPGIEDIVIAEVKEKLKLNAKQGEFAGRVELETENWKRLLKLRSIYHIIRFVDKFKFKTLNDIYKKLCSLEIPELINASSFRVTSKRRGVHKFSSMELQKIAGQALVDKYHKKVSLKEFDIEILVDAYGNECFVGVCLTKESLHKRYERVFDHPTALKHPLAYAMLKLADVKAGFSLLDPFCGSGTIPIEAALNFDGRIKIFASDINEEFIKGARTNAEKAGVKELIKFKIADASQLNKFYSKNFFDVVITNPPYGARMRIKNLKQLYKNFLESAASILKQHGKIVVIALRANSFRDLVFKTKLYCLEHERVVDLGNLWPHIFVLRKLN